MNKNPQSRHQDRGASGKKRSGRNAVLNHYMNEIRLYPLLSREEELALAREVKNGSSKALNRLVERNLRFVVKIAREYRYLGLPFEDLINEGNLGLIEAAKRFDPERDTKFTSWAIWWVRKAIRIALSEQTHVVRLPFSQLRRMREVRATEMALKRDLGREPTRDEISAKLPKQLAELDPIHRHGIRLTSLDKPAGDEHHQTLGETLEDDHHDSVESRMLDAEAADRVAANYERLDPRERFVLSRRFGLDGQKPQTLEEIGLGIGRSHETVRMIERKAVERLRRLLNDKPRRVRKPLRPVPLAAPTVRRPTRSDDDFDHAA